MEEQATAWSAIYATAIEKINTPSIQTFVMDITNTYGTEELATTAVAATEWLYSWLDWRGMLHNPKQGLGVATDIMLAATLLHNLFFQQGASNLRDLFKAREILWESTLQYGLPVDWAEPLYGTIESQLGQLHPIPACRPQNGSPGDMVATAIWAVTKE